MPITTTGTTPNNFLYSGEQFDSALGMYYLRARYYNAAPGRLLTMDPSWGNILDPRTLDKYVYTGDNPVNASDPTGRGILENLEIRAFIFTQITVPGYVQAGVAAVGGVKGIIAGGTGLAFLAGELYETFECAGEKVESADAQPPLTPIVTVPTPSNTYIGPPHSDKCLINFHDDWPGIPEGSPLGPGRVPEDYE
jgi:RHS repeat-associated protein